MGSPPPRMLHMPLVKTDLEDWQECKRLIDEYEEESVPIDISDTTFLVLAKLAHEQDITFNELCNNILRNYMDKEENSCAHVNGCKKCNPECLYEGV